MSDTNLLTWLNSNGVAVGAVCSLVGFWFGFRSNLWIARRSEWNAIVDKARLPLVQPQSRDRRDMNIAAEDLDSLLAQAGCIRRRKIRTVLTLYAAIWRGEQGYFGVNYSRDERAQMDQLRSQMLSLLRRR